ncbi:hypothetical protein ALC57_06105 [Trachymyrmex cornetzi]|uniref:Uncharacterized protein n=1 Tax=Trachymyrmex cornetzi TaxID=471704 RepID=A0A195E8Q1_9HYME|nr:hypothetical protein ALC57_06105 [Trachymyrmex cornetzi]
MTSTHTWTRHCTASRVAGVLTGSRSSIASQTRRQQCPGLRSASQTSSKRSLGRYTRERKDDAKRWRRRRRRKRRDAEKGPQGEDEDEGEDEGESKWIDDEFLGSIALFGVNSNQQAWTPLFKKNFMQRLYRLTQLTGREEPLRIDIRTTHEATDDGEIMGVRW